MFRGLTQAVTLVRSGIIDREYYQALTGEQFRSPLAVARHFLSSPERADLSVHPLFEPRFLQRTPDPDLVLHYLEHPGQFRKQSPHPVFDLAAAKNALRSACVQYPEGAWLAWVRTAKADTPVPVAAQSRPVLWGDLRDSLIRAAAQWREPDPDRDPTDLRQAAATDRRASLTSIVVPIAGDLAAALARLQLLKTTEASELICTGFTSRAQLSCFTALSRTRPVVVVRAADTDLARQWNLGAAASSGERLVFVAPNAVLKSTAIDHLVAALSDTRTVIVQPLNETPAMTVHSAGAYFSPGEVVPSPLLHDHPTVDAEGLGTTAVPAAYSVVTAIRSQDFFDLGGFEERYGNNYVEVDLSLRAAGSGMGDVTLVPDARATLRPLRSAGSRNDTVASAELLRAQHHAPSAGGDDLLGTAGFRVAEYLEQKLITADPDAG